MERVNRTKKPVEIVLKRVGGAKMTENNRGYKAN
jgi:hypothetical protein